VLLLQFAYFVCTQISLPIRQRIYNTISAYHCSRVEHSIASYFSVMPNDGSQFRSFGSNNFHLNLFLLFSISLLNSYFLSNTFIDFYQHTIEFVIRDDCTCSKMGMNSKNRITYIIKMSNLTSIHQYRIFYLAAVANETSVPQYSKTTNICSFTDFAIRANETWTCN
jgi:hypothetical protein